MKDLHQARIDLALDVTLAVAIGCALAFVMVMWWSA